MTAEQQRAVEETLRRGLKTGIARLNEAKANVAEQLDSGRVRKTDQMLDLLGGAVVMLTTVAELCLHNACELRALNNRAAGQQEGGE